MATTKTHSIPIMLIQRKAVYDRCRVQNPWARQEQKLLAWQQPTWIQYTVTSLGFPSRGGILREIDASASYAADTILRMFGVVAAVVAAPGACACASGPEGWISAGTQI